jgi:hypothetical protein
MRIDRLATLAVLAAATLAGCDSAREVDGARSGASACSTCHGYPPPPGTRGGGQSHFADPDCSKCHVETVADDDLTLLPASAGGKHANGAFDFAHVPLACSACHDPSALPVTPPQNLHPFHNVTRGVACATCHAGYVQDASVNDELHGNEIVDVVLELDGTAIEGADADGAWAEPTCTQCHAKLGVPWP